MLLLTDLETLRLTTLKLKSQSDDLRNSDETLRSELLALSGSLEHMAGSNEDRWRSNDLKWVKNSANFEQWLPALGEINSYTDMNEIVTAELMLFQILLSSFFLVAGPVLFVVFYSWRVYKLKCRG